MIGDNSIFSQFGHQPERCDHTWMVEVKLAAHSFRAYGVGLMACLGCYMHSNVAACTGRIWTHLEDNFLQQILHPVLQGAYAGPHLLSLAVK